MLQNLKCNNPLCQKPLYGKDFWCSLECFYAEMSEPEECEDCYDQKIEDYRNRQREIAESF